MTVVGADELQRRELRPPSTTRSTLAKRIGAIAVAGGFLRFVVYLGTGS